MPVSIRTHRTRHKTRLFELFDHAARLPHADREAFILAECPEPMLAKLRALLEADLLAPTDRSASSQSHDNAPPLARNSEDQSMEPKGSCALTTACNALTRYAQIVTESTSAEDALGACTDPRVETQLTALLDAGAGPLSATRLSGHRFENHVIGAQLGSGGMGDVWLAAQLAPQRIVALKLARRAPGLDARIAEMSAPLPREQLLAEQRADLMSESDSLARLNHPGFASIFEVGEMVIDGDAHPYFTMELVAGEHPFCRDALIAAAKSLGQQRVLLEHLHSVMDAVSHAHRFGIVHFDLKPSNVRLNAEGHPLVLDLGLAAMVGPSFSRPNKRQDSRRGGTVSHMSPEQTDTPLALLDARSDVYSLGVMLYQVLTSELPYDLNGLNHEAVFDRIRTAVPRKLPRLAKRHGRPMASIVAKALAKDKADRHQDAEELACDLRAYLDHRPVPSHSGGAIYRTAMFVRRNPNAVAATTIAGALALILGVVYLVDITRTNNQLAREITHKTTAFETRDRAADAAATESKRSLQTMLTAVSSLADAALHVTDQVTASGVDRATTVQLLESFESAHLALAASATADQYRRSEIAALIERIAAAYFRLGDRERSRETFERFVTMQRQLVQADPDMLAWQSGLAAHLLRLANERAATGDAEGQLAALVESVDLFKALVRDPTLPNFNHEASIPGPQLQTICRVNFGRAVLQLALAQPAHTQKASSPDAKAALAALDAARRDAPTDAYLLQMDPLLRPALQAASEGR